MQSTYLRFQRPDGSQFNKLPTIPQSQIDDYVAAGCVQMEPESAPGGGAGPSLSDRPEPVSKRRTKKKGGQ